MPGDVVAFSRRQGVFLACVVGEEPPAGPARRDDGATLALVAEDGARFRLPAARVVARVQAPLARAGDEGDAAWLGRLRQSIQPFADWLGLRAGLTEGAELSIDEVAAAAGTAGPEGLLRIALGAAAAEPWFRRVDGRFTVIPMQEALRRLFELNLRRFDEAGDAVLSGWWETGGATGLPAGWPSGVALAVALAEERARFFEPAYDPDRDLAAAAALAEVVRHALADDAAASPRGAAFAARVGRGDDADLLVEELVARGALDPATDPSPHRAGLTDTPDDDVRADAARVAALPVDADARVDLTELLAVAVDSAGTFEVDDALSVRRVGGVLELLVHVVDCGRVAPATPLDTWAHARASSLYVPDGSVPMFPRAVVDALSLAPEVRPALSLIVTLDAGLAVVATRLERSLVRVARQIDYAATNDVASLAGSSADGALLVEIAGALRAARRARGARIVTVPSPDVALVDGRPELRLRMQDTPGDLVVSEAMVLYNAAGAGRLAEARAPALFRSQDGESDARRLPPDPDDPLYEPRLRRSFAPTVVTTEPAPHVGVGAAAYVQLTSPLRRYADLANQRQLAAVLAGTPPPLQHAAMEELGEHLARRERRVRHASDARLKYWIARYVEGLGTTSLDGLLSRSPRRGVGAVWVPALRREVTLKCARSWRPPPEGTAARWRVARVLPWRGRIEVEPAAEEMGGP